MVGLSTRAWRRLAIALGIVIVLLALLDRGGLWLAEYETGKTIQNSQHLKSRPDIEISGFPFLTQLITGSFDEVTADADDVPVHTHGRTLIVQHMHVVLDDVHASRTFTTFHTKKATATALIALADLGDTLRVQLSYAGQGRVQAAKTVTVLGRRLTGTVSALPKLVGQGLTFDAVQVSGLDGLDGPAGALLDKVFAITLPLTGIPFGLHVQSLQVDAKGVHLVFAGTDISYTRP